MTFEALSTIVVLAIIVEFTTEIVKTIFPVIHGQYSRLVALLDNPLPHYPQRVTGNLPAAARCFSPNRYFITGLIISRGNILHDLVSKLNMANVKS